MNDIREELEQNLASALEKEQSPAPTETTPESTPGEQIAPPPPVDEYLLAPKSFKQEYAEAFKALSPEMRKYLHQRESETTKGFSEVNNKLTGYKWVDEGYKTREERAKAAGFADPKSYYDYLAQVDDALTKNPQAVLQAFTHVYGQNAGAQDPNGLQKLFTDRLSNMEKQFNDFNQFMQSQQQAASLKAIEDFANSKNEDGSSKYPHIYNEDVGAWMDALINTGKVQSLEEAYNSAIWQVEGIRGDLVKAQTQADLAKAAKEAEKAKNAGFNVQNSTTAPVENLENMTTRQILEKKFAELPDE